MQFHCMGSKLKDYLENLDAVLYEMRINRKWHWDKKCQSKLTVKDVKTVFFYFSESNDFRKFGLFCVMKNSIFIR